MGISWKHAAGLAAVAAAFLASRTDAQTVLEHVTTAGDPLVLGDLDGDGISELLLREPGFTHAVVLAGKVTLLSGADLSTIYVRLGTEPLQSLGSRCASIGDVSGDGVPDYFVGDNLPIPSGGAGHTTLLSGASHEALMTFACSPRVDRLGDLDLDGVDDFGVQVGFVLEARSGATGDVIFVDSDAFLARVAALGDADGDGVDDYATAAYDLDSSHFRIVSGATGATHLLFESGPYAVVGRDIAAAGDVDGDGLGDIVVGSSDRARVFSGVDGVKLHQWKPPEDANPNPAFGWAVEGNVDLDGDGVPDVLASAIRHDHKFVGGVPYGEATGRVFAYSGATGARLFDVWGAGPDSDYGFDVAAMGDRDGDGVVDLVVRNDAGFDIVSGSGTDATLGTTAIATISTDDFDEMFLLALKGTKLKVRAWVDSGSVVPRVTFRRADDAVVKALDFDYAKDGTPSLEKAKLKADGLHRMRVLNLPKYDFQSGVVRVEVDVVHPKAARPRTLVKKGKPGKTLRAAVAALPGATLNATLVLKKGYAAPPRLSVVGPDGAPIDAAPYVTTEPGLVHLTGLPVTALGVHRLEVPAGPSGKSKVAFHLDPVQPAPGPPLAIE